MQAAGTSPSYSGLYACVMNATHAAATELEATPCEFAPVRAPKGITGAMVEIDAAFEHLAAVRTAGWITPLDHPDLVPAAEAGRLADYLRLSGEDPRPTQLGDNFARRLASALRSSSDLEEALVRLEASDSLEQRWQTVAASCKDCHVAYRDRRRR